jgi:hypothetical protein
MRRYVPVERSHNEKYHEIIAQIQSQQVVADQVEDFTLTPLANAGRNDTGRLNATN